MKKLLAMLFLSFICISCEKITTESIGYKSDFGLGAKVEVIDVDSCQYVIYKNFDTGGIVHKQNCKYCIERNKNK